MKTQFGQTPTPMTRFAAATRPAMPTPRFGSAAAAARVGASMADHNITKVMKALDFQELATATINQIKVIYGLCILSRIVAAATRSKNEVRETATRDSMGFAFWFFATPMIQRLFLRYVAPKELRDSLIVTKPRPEAGKGLLGKLKELSWRINPLSRWEIPSSQQVKDRMFQALDALEKQGYSKTDEAYIKLSKHFASLVKWRNLATGLGIGITIALLGVGINLYNIYMTRKALERGESNLGGH